MEFWLILIFIIVAVWVVGRVLRYFRVKKTALYTAKKEIEELEKELRITRKQVALDVEAMRKLSEKEKDIDEAKRELDAMKKLSEDDRKAIVTLAQQKAQGFPWLAKAYADYFYLRKLEEADYLEHKSHPARVSAERVREIARERRIIEEKFRVAQGIISYYQDLFPFLEEFLGEPEEEILKYILSRNIEEPIKEVGGIGIDPVRIYLSKEEYQKLSPAERNQRALDRYWTRPKNSWQVGRDYERYIGYIYEVNDYGVYYQGILEGFDDLGRDLICKKGQETIIVQCKRWSQYKTIHEKHVNQLYGTVIKYIIDHPEEKVAAVLYTTTKLSDRAKEFAKYLSIGVAEEFPFQKYPSIKCNVSRKNGEKIYHLPFDQQYDRTLLEDERNELYVEAAEEAENLGFRRAWRWTGYQPQ